jgi:signal peptidase
MSEFHLNRVLGVPLTLNTDDGTSDASALITVSGGGREESVLVNKYGVSIVDPRTYVMAPKERVQQKRIRVSPIKAGINASGWVAASILFTFVLLQLTGIIQSKVVLTSSMVPAIKPGDVAVSTSVKHLAPKIGRVVIYTGRRMDGSAVADFAHRIVGGDAVTGFSVKGDANPSPDTQHPKLADIRGVVLFTIPWIGHLLSPQYFAIVLLAIFGVWLIVDAFREENE